MIKLLGGGSAQKASSVRNGKISGWGDGTDLYKVTLVSGSTLYNVAGPSGLSVNNWVSVASEAGRHTILNAVRYDATDLVEVTV